MGGLPIPQSEFEAREKANADAKRAADEAARLAKEAEDAVRALTTEMMGIGHELGLNFAAGIFENDWSGLGAQLGGMLSNSIAQAVSASSGGGIMGGLFGGVIGGLLDFGIGKLFGGGPKGGTASDPVYTYETNQIKPEDIVGAFLRVAQVAQQRGASRGLDFLNNQRLAQGSTGIGV
jgi:hypothetical protein